MMAEGNDTPGGEPGRSTPRSEGDLLSERRARRAAESGEVALTRRAEAAEATVHTLERHVASLQQRLREAEESQRQISEALELERSAALEREHELRRVKQREYAEQQLRVEAEDRLTGVDRESRAELERIGARLSAGEEDVRELSEHLEDVQSQLADAQQSTAGERATVRRIELELQTRVGELERRALEMQRGFDGERSARERAERLLEGMRDGHRQMGGLLGDLKAIVERLMTAVEAGRRQPAATPAPVAQAVIPPPPPPVAQAVVPLEPEQEPALGTSPAAAAPPAPAEAAPIAPPARVEPTAAAPVRVTPPPARAEPEFQPRNVSPEARGAEMADALAAAVERLRARAEVAPEFAEPAPAARAAAKPHKHSMSLITRVRRWRKQRRNR